MAIDPASLTDFLGSDVSRKISNLITIFQAIGGLAIAYLVFNIISLWQGRKKRRDIERIRELLESIDRKLSRKK